MLRDVRSWQEHVREESLMNFHHHVAWWRKGNLNDVVTEIGTHLKVKGYQIKEVKKESAVLVTAKKGAGNKWGYIFAHTAIVIICIGGLLDSNLSIRFQTWFMGKVPYVGSGIMNQIPSKHRLSANNPSYRANMFIPEGARSGTAVLSMQDGVLLQDLPFALYLKKFTIDYYSTGMPKLFVSDVGVYDPETGKTFDAQIKVNSPLIYKGVAVYQSSFEDGGSRLQLKGYPMVGVDTKTFPLNGVVGESTPLLENKLTVEWSGFRALNVEDISGNKVNSVEQSVRSRKQAVIEELNKHTGSSGKELKQDKFKNMGPSVQYKLRDQTGQAREYNNYMLPVLVDGASVFLSGVRTSPDEQFGFLRIPADDKNSLEEWMQLRATLSNPALRLEAARQYVKKVSKEKTQSAEWKTQLEDSAFRSLSLFAGNEKGAGYIAVSHFLEGLPTGEQEKVAMAFMKILRGSLWELWQVSRAQRNLPLIPMEEKYAKFLELSANAISDASFYGAPVYLNLEGFDEVKASVFQVTKSPGKKIVYLGCALLVLGIFSMFYIRERRIWVWVKKGDNDVSVLMAMNSQRKTLDFENEFNTFVAHWKSMEEMK
jgi:cytochrome c biogenesis protein